MITSPCVSAPSCNKEISVCCVLVRFAIPHLYLCDFLAQNFGKIPKSKLLYIMCVSMKPVLWVF